MTGPLRGSPFGRLSVVLPVELVPGGDVDVAHPLGPRSAAEVQRARVPRERRTSLADGRVDRVSELGRRRPRIVDAVTRGDPDVLALRAGPVRREDDLA